MAKAGLPQLNLARNSISIKSSASSSLSSAKRSGVSYGIMAQRSNNSIFSPKLAYSGRISAMRHQLNSRVIINNNMPPVHRHQDNGMDSMETLMMISMMGKMTTELGKGIADTIKSMKSDKSEKTPDTGSQPKTESGTMKELSAKNTKVNDDINKFGQDYSKIAKENVSSINSSLDKFKSNENTQKYLSGLDTSALANEDLGLSGESSLEDINAASGSITKDIGEVQTFIGNINTTIGKLTTDIQSLAGQIAGLEGKHKTPEEQTKLDSLKQQKKDLEALQKELKDKVLNEANSLEGKLKAESENLTKLAETKKQVMDKMYKQAQEDDKSIGENNKKMDKLDAQIKKETDSDKKQKLIKEYNSLATANKALDAGLTAAGTIKSSAGTEFSRTNQANVTPYPTDGSEPKLNDTASGKAKENGSYFNLNGNQNSLNAILGLANGSGQPVATTQNNRRHDSALLHQIEETLDKGQSYTSGDFVLTKKGSNYVLKDNTPTMYSLNGSVETFNSLEAAMDYINTPQRMRKYPNFEGANFA